MNGPLKMYKTRQIIIHDMPVQVPQCMYQMKNILGHCNDRSEHVSSADRNLDISDQNYIPPEMATLILRQEKILEQLAELKEQMLTIRSSLNLNEPKLPKPKLSVPQPVVRTPANQPDLVLNVNPSNPPYSLLFLRKLWSSSLQLVVQNYTHSSLLELPKVAQDFVALLNKQELNNEAPQVLIRLIWKNVNETSELILSPLRTPIHGEVNLLRYLSKFGPSNYNYDLWSNATEVDSILDICFLLSRSRTKTERHSLMQSLHGNLGKSQWLCNQNELNIADIAAYSAIKQVAAPADVNVNLTKWLQRCEQVL